MNLELSHKGDYAVRAALCLAAAWDGGGSYRKIREVAEAMELPRSYTPQILGLLAQAGLAEAKAGRDGGYRLSRPPEAVSVLEVVEAAEGHLVSEHCPLRGGPCHWEDACALHPTWIEASEAVRDALTRTSLADVVRVDRDLESGRAVLKAPPRHRRSARRDRPAPARTKA